MFNAAMIILWIAIGLTVLEIIAKIFVQNNENNQDQNNDNQDNNQEKQE